MRRRCMEGWTSGRLEEYTVHPLTHSSVYTHIEAEGRLTRYIQCRAEERSYNGATSYNGPTGLGMIALLTKILTEPNSTESVRHKLPRSAPLLL